MKMKKSSLTWIIIAAVVIIGLVIFFSMQHGGSTGIANTNSGQAAGQNGPVKLADTPYANSAYLISGDTLSSNAQQALSGFSLSKQTLSDGSVNITLTAINSEYQNQSYIVKPGEQLYFLEMSFGDDSYPDGEYNLRDDAGVLVDSNGYIVQ